MLTRTVVQAFADTHVSHAVGQVRVSTTAGRADLVRLFAAAGFTTGAEIGVWVGDFSKVLCQGVPGLHLTAVDPWKVYDEYSRDRKNDQVRLDGAYQLAKAALERFDCTIVRKMSLEAAASVPDGSLDFVYIDSNHAAAFVRQDLEAWTPKVRKGGICSGHDYQFNPRPHIQVKAAVDAFASARGIGPICVLAADKSPSYFWEVA